MSNIDFDGDWILLANSDFQSKNAKITIFWNRVPTEFIVSSRENNPRKITFKKARRLLL